MGIESQPLVSLDADYRRSAMAGTGVAYREEEEIVRLNATEVENVSVRVEITIPTIMGCEGTHWEFAVK